MQDKKDKIYIHDDYIDLCDSSKKIVNNEYVDEIHKNEIDILPILLFMTKYNISRKQFAEMCDITYEQLDKLLDDFIPIEVIRKIERTLRLKENSLISEFKSTFYFD